MISEESIGVSQDPGIANGQPRSSRAFHDALAHRSRFGLSRRSNGFRAGMIASLASIKDSSPRFERGHAVGRVLIESTLFLAGGIAGAGAVLLTIGGEGQIKWGALAAAGGLTLGLMVALFRFVARPRPRPAA